MAASGYETSVNCSSVLPCSRLPGSTNWNCDLSSGVVSRDDFELVRIVLLGQKRMFQRLFECDVAIYLS